jgi:hypothetical protein
MGVPLIVPVMLAAPILESVLHDRVRKAWPAVGVLAATAKHALNEQREGCQIAKNSGHGRPRLHCGIIVIIGSWVKLSLRIIRNSGKVHLPASLLAASGSAGYDLRHRASEFALHISHQREPSS